MTESDVVVEDLPRRTIVERVVETRLPTTHGTFQAIGYLDRDGNEQMAVVYGDLPKSGALTRVHSECLTGDVFGSIHCECGDQLATALRAIIAEGAGVLVYLQGHEGRGIGLLAKLKAMALQDEGLDTVEANVALGLPVDARDYHAAAGDPAGSRRRRRCGCCRTTRARSTSSAGTASACASRCRCWCRRTRRTSATCGPSGSAWTTCSRTSTRP